MHAHPFAREDFPSLLSLVAHNAAERVPGRSYLMTSDVAWQFPGSAPKDNIRLWRDAAGLAAYGWFQPPDTILFDVRTDLADSASLAAEILEWAEIRRADFPPGYPLPIDLRSMQEWADALRNPQIHPLAENRYVVASALASDQARRNLLASHGYELTAHFEPILLHGLDEGSIPQPSAAFTLRHVHETELEERLALHAAAWAPSAGFDMKRYLSIRSISEVFDPELDIVAVAADGTFASYTIAWQDPLSQIGSFEPFGTRPEFRGSGVSRMVIGEGLRRLAARGMSSVRIYTAGFNHPAARLYRSCGFADVDRNLTYLKRV